MYIEIQCSFETIRVVYKLSDALTEKRTNTMKAYKRVIVFLINRPKRISQ